MDNFDMNASVESKKKDISAFLNSGLCRVTFMKKDGSVRTVTGTLLRDLIPEDKSPKGTDRVHNVEVQPIYEVDLDEWRSFRWDSVISYEAE